MTNIIDYIDKCGSWIFETFKGDDVAPKKRDVSGLIARWLFRIGIIWAALLLKIAVVAFVFTPILLISLITRDKPSGSLHLEDLLLPLFLLAGFTIWFGWGWRSRKPRSLKPCALFWLASAAFHAIPPVKFWLETDGFSPPLLWYLPVAAASLVAFCFELCSPRVEAKQIDS